MNAPSGAGAGALGSRASLPARGLPVAAAGPDFVERCRDPRGFVDSDHPVVRAVAAAAGGSAESARARAARLVGAVRLFYAVRDRLRYDPFTCTTRRDDYRASTIAATERTWCVPKAVLLAATARAAGIPAAIGLADVTNHLTSEKLRRTLGGIDLFVDHGYCALWLHGRWVKAAAVFNRELCERFAVRPTEFDGEHDALLQEYDAADRRHMTYLRDDGLYDDLPFDTVMDDFRAVYPASVFEAQSRSDGPRFEDQRRA